MKPDELFNLINSVSYKKTGDNVNYCIVINDEGKIIYLLFQPSVEFRDWVNNFNFPVKIYKEQENNLLIQRGWGNAWKSCNDEIIKALIDVYKNHSEYKIIIAGWSYGGAMAQIAAEDLHYRTSLKADVITFGSPKPFFGRKTQKYVRSCCNIVKNYSVINDVVPYLPPFIGYKLINKVEIGCRLNIKKLFNPVIYHCSYNDESLYRNEG